MEQEFKEAKTDLRMFEKMKVKMAKKLESRKKL